MKKLLGICMAFGLAAAAQAANWAWSQNGGATGTATGNPTVSAWDNTNGGVVTLGGIFTFKQDASIATDGTAIMTIMNSKDSTATAAKANTNGIRVVLNSDGSLALQYSNTNGNLSWKGDGVTDPATVNVLDGKQHAIALLINNAKNELNGIIGGGFALVVDGQIVCKYTTGGAVHFWKTELDALTYGADGVTTDVDLFGQEGLAAVGDIVVPQEVPEPTALALLALGVAGLALRRRAA